MCMCCVCFLCTQVCGNSFCNFDLSGVGTLCLRLTGHTHVIVNEPRNHLMEWFCFGYIRLTVSIYVSMYQGLLTHVLVLAVNYNRNN